MPNRKKFTDIDKGFIIANVQAGLSAREKAKKYKKYGCHASSVQYYVPQYRKYGDVTSKRGNGGRKRNTDARSVVRTPQK